jgi:mRNA interferase HigB
MSGNKRHCPTTGLPGSEDGPIILPKWEGRGRVRIIAKSTLRRFWEQPCYRDARGPLESWHEEVLQAVWTSPQDVKEQYRNASICGNNRVVFNIGGNKYRLVVEVQYRLGIVWVKFLGTHAQYDRIDVESVNDY